MSWPIYNATDPEDELDTSLDNVRYAGQTPLYHMNTGGLIRYMPPDPLGRGQLLAYHYMTRYANVPVDVSQYIMRLAVRGRILDLGGRDISFTSSSGGDNGSWTLDDTIHRESPSMTVHVGIERTFLPSDVIIFRSGYYDYFEAKRRSSFLRRMQSRSSEYIRDRLESLAMADSGADP